MFVFEQFDKALNANGTKVKVEFDKFMPLENNTVQAKVRSICACLFVLAKNTDFTTMLVIDSCNPVFFRQV